MPRPIGLLKTGGRQAGTPNRKTTALHEALEAAGIDVPTQLGALLPQLSIERRVDALLSLMPYLFPRRKAIEQAIEFSPVECPNCSGATDMTPEQRDRRIAELEQLDRLLGND